MHTVTVSPKFQIVIPKEIREQMKLKPGQKLHLIQIADKIEFVLPKNVKDTKGMLSGMNTSLEREEDRV